MLCHRESERDSQHHSVAKPTGNGAECQPGVEAQPSASGRRKGLLTAAAVGLTGVGVHVPCIIAGLGVAGVAGWGIHAACTTGHSEDSNRSFGVEIERLPALPDRFQEIRGERALAASHLLLEFEPRFQDILDAKVREAKGEPIEMVFLDSDGEISVVICKNGGLCPCSEPQAYTLGNRADVVGAERFPGQFQILKTLLSEQ